MKDGQKGFAAQDRRAWFGTVGKVGLGVAACGLMARGPAEAWAGQDPAYPEPDITPTEDLMQEHELLNRTLLIYDEARARLRQSAAVDLEALQATARLIRLFVEDYHEKNEENDIFPHFAQAKEWTELVRTLKSQHDAGRRLTDAILRLARRESLARPQDLAQLGDALGLFVRMYRPHESREGSLLFPAFRTMVPAAELRRLGEVFEARERQALGPEGFEGMVKQVASLEEHFGLADLTRFSP